MSTAAAILPIVVLAAAYVAWLVRDIRRSDVRHVPKWAWIVIVIVSIPLGGIIYLLAGRERR